MALALLELPRFELRTDAGLLVVRDGLVVTFFVPLSHCDAAPLVRSSIVHYLRLRQIPNALWLLDDEGNPQLHDASSLATLLESKLRPSAAECDFWMADEGNGAPRFRVRYHGLDLNRRRSEGWPRVTSGVSFAFPTDYLGESGLLEIFGFANEIARQLPFSFGLVAPAFLQAEGSLEPAAFEMIRRLSRRYLCLEIPALLPDCFECADLPKGAYWGNYFGGSLLKSIGEEVGLRVAFGNAEVRFEALAPNALSVYLDRLPVAGDVNRQEDVSKYRAAFKAFSSQSVERTLSYANFDDEAFEAWICRFVEEDR